MPVVADCGCGFSEYCISKEGQTNEDCEGKKCEVEDCGNPSVGDDSAIPSPDDEVVTASLLKASTTSAKAEPTVAGSAKAEPAKSKPTKVEN